MSNKLTDNEIVKALECCSNTSNKKCQNCPLYNHMGCCWIVVEKSAIDLINRLQARLGIYETCNARKDESIRNLEAENERLKTEKDNLIKNYRECQVDNLKEFAERLKAKATPHYFDNYDFAVSIDEIDNLLKEMVGDSNA